MKASLKNYRQSPRKVRLVVKSIRGKKVVEALTILSFMPKRAAGPLHKLISSALANAKNAGLDISDLIIKTIEVNKGVVLKRIMPRARGSAYGINKRTSHVLVTLGKKEIKTKSVKTTKQETIAKPETEVKPVPVKAPGVAKKAVKKTKSQPLKAKS